ncbi:hypothetical protein LLQ46_05005 [Rouxiella badensis]|uniref:hypothetical protein n=1 Tax=Rouxiella badensis TaxID=1646377 RepID=UPI001B4760DA|nr:hypothetical protein [Rouxiella badensis]MCC3746199.1 hypothetical protein [Rouxiella badensis]
MSDKISERKPDGGLAEWIEVFEASDNDPTDAEFLMLLIELRARRAAEVKHPDQVRMDWLCAHTVEVRQPLVYGSHAMFWAQCDSEDDEEHHTKLREQIDEAIKAAGGTVEE